MALDVVWHNPQYSDEEINVPIQRVLDENIMLSMATVHTTTEGTVPWICSLYYAYGPDLSLYVLTYPESEHILNTRKNPAVACAIAAPQEPHQHKTGLQIAGTVAPVDDGELTTATTLFSDRFTWVRDFVPHPEDWATTSLVSRLYKITPRRIKIFSEHQVGNEMWFDLTVRS